MLWTCSNKKQKLFQTILGAFGLCFGIIHEILLLVHKGDPGLNIYIYVYIHIMLF
jgi:hypothetical protein